MKDIIINDRYRVIRPVAEGSFGFVYAGIDTQTGQEVAMKLIPHEPGVRFLFAESELCKRLNGDKKAKAPKGFPQWYWYGQQDEYEVLVLQMLGPSLTDLATSLPGGHRAMTSLKTTLLIAEQGITRVWQMHNKGVLHTDLKPENILMGTGRLGNMLYIIDFGSSISDTDPRAASPGRIGEPGSNPFVGTDWFASIAVHEGYLYSYSDDLESLAYTLLFLYYGNLPWIPLAHAWMSRSAQGRIIATTKREMSVEELCEGLPDEFARFLREVRATPRGTKPRYSAFRNMFRKLYQRLGFENDFCFDWTENRYQQMLENGDFDQPQLALP